MSFRGKAVASNMKNSFRGKGMLAETTGAWKANWKGAKKVGDGSYARGAGPYEGEWSGNIRHGSGKQMWDCGPLIGCIYEGEWKHGQTNGEGKFTHLDGSTFSGMVSEFVRTTPFAGMQFMLRSPAATDPTEERRMERERERERGRERERERERESE